MSTGGHVAGGRGLRIGFVTNSASRAAGGLFNSVRASAQELHRTGNDVGVLSLRDRYSVEDCDHWLPLVPRFHEVQGPAFFGYSKSLERSLMEADFDLVHQQGIWMYPSVAVDRWRRKSRGPSMISPRGMLDDWALRNAAWKKKVALSLYESRNLRSASCLHALSVFEAQSMRTLGLTAPIVVIPNGVHLRDSAGVNPRPAFLGDEKRKLLVSLGRLHPKKGLLETLKGWSLLRQRAPGLLQEWVLVIAGWGTDAYAASLKKAAVELQIEDSVCFPGPVFNAEKHQLLGNADAFVLASHSEGLPMAVLEAWAYGVPVFMSRACNLPEGFVADAAIEVPPDPGEIANRLAAGLSSPALPGIGANGRALVAAHYTWAAVGARLEKAYAWLCGGAPPPDDLYRQ